MTSLFLLILSLCPSIGTGTIHFVETIKHQESADTFRGIMAVEDSTIRMDVWYPDSQKYLLKNDSLYMFSGRDTIVAYRKGLLSLLFDLNNNASLKKISFEHGCEVIPYDTLMPDTIYLFGQEFIDSLRARWQDSEINIRLWRGMK